MFILSPVLLVLVLVAVIVAVSVSRHRTRQPFTPTTMSSAAAPDAPFDAPPGPQSGLPVPRAATLDASLSLALERWQSAGLLTAEQADAISQFESTPAAAPETVTVPAAPRRIPAVAEALGYLGGILGLVGLTLLMTRYWPDMGTATRLGLSLGVTVGLTVAGAFVPRRGEPVFERLRSFIWLGATAAAGLTAFVLAKDVADATKGHTIALACAGAVTVYSAVLWAGSTRAAQHITFLAGALVTAGTLVAQWFDLGVSGLAVWATALVMLVVGLRHLGPHPEISLAVGAAGSAVGSALTVAQWHGPGRLLFAGMAVCLLTLAVIEDERRTLADRIVLAVVGVVAALSALPETLVWFARNAGIATGLAVWILGAITLVMASTDRIHLPITTQIAGGLTLVSGAAICGVQSVAFATTFGLATALALLVFGTRPDHALMSVFGSIGLLVNVPWAIQHFFPGEGRVPLLIFVSGVVIIGVAVLLSRMGGQLRHDLQHHPRHHLHLRH